MKDKLIFVGLIALGLVFPILFLFYILFYFLVVLPTVRR